MITSPRENVAEDEVNALQKAQTEIKAIIVKDLTEGVDKKITEAKIKVIIDEAVAVTSLEKQAIRNSLVVLAKNSYWITSKNYRVLKERFAKEMRQIEPSYTIGAGFNLRQEQERFRNFVDTAPKGLPVIESYQKRVKSVMSDLAKNPAKVQIYRNGKAMNYSQRNYAEMTVRYQANQEDIANFKDEGNDLVFTSSHADCSIRCQQFQGKLYSISGKSGMIDNIEYTPLSEATAGKDGDGNGIIVGYNCRHRLIPYQRGLKPPVEYSSAFIKKQRQIDQQQRRYENDIRQLKTRERLARETDDKEEAQRLRASWNSKLDNYKAYSFKNGRAFYQWRTVV